MKHDDKIAILGFGVEGKSVLKYLEKHVYPNVTICDKDVDLKQHLPEGVSANLGDKYLENPENFDVIFRSPGIPYLNPAIQSAVAKGAFVTSNTDFFMDQCPCSVIGVTGTKGKGTTATLIYKILKKARKKVFLAGNIGEPPMNFLDKLKKDNLVVLELSSFQLQDLRKSPHYAVLLNTTIDHLDYHVDSEEYMEAKESLLVNQNKKGVAVLNKDYEYVKYYKPLAKGAVKFVSVKEDLKDGAFVKDGFVFYSKKGKKEKIIGISEIGLIGSHNLENVLPAVVIAKEFGIKNAVIAAVLKSFKGLPHRLEFVRTVNGVKYYNDSFSTNPLTCMAAVDSFDKPTILIAGGSSKGLDYNEWATKILTKASLRTVILIGQTADKMEQELIAANKRLGDAASAPTKVIRRRDLEEAVIEAYAEAENGWIIVMSPAAASFDQFKNYKERGEKFKTEVARLR